MTHELRTLKRRHLIYYLEVHDDETGELLGNLVDITTEGLKLVSKAPLQAKKLFKMRMNLPEGYFGEKELRFEAMSMWSSNDINPDFYDTGFNAPDLDSKVKNIILTLIALMGFND